MRPSHPCPYCGHPSAADCRHAAQAAPAGFGSGCLHCGCDCVHATGGRPLTTRSAWTTDLADLR